MSSATAMEGWVSFNCTANFSWNRVTESAGTRRRIMSCRAQQTKKYCCSRRSPLPAILVVRVQHLAQVLGDHLLVDGAVVVAAVEGAKSKDSRRLGAAQPQGVGGVVVVAEDGRVVGRRR